MPETTWLHRNRKNPFSECECQTAADSCSHKKEFRLKFDTMYQKCLREGWDVCSKLPPSPRRGGFRKSTFIEYCEKNNNGIGLLYMIMCWNKNEKFYKIGITSKGSVKRRYSKKTDMPYGYKIIWTLEGDPGIIWDMEKQKHRETKKYRYQPELWPGQAMETFKCHGNCKILRKPEI